MYVLCLAWKQLYDFIFVCTCYSEVMQIVPLQAAYIGTATPVNHRRGHVHGWTDYVNLRFVVLWGARTYVLSFATQRVMWHTYMPCLCVARLLSRLAFWQTQFWFDMIKLEKCIVPTAKNTCFYFRTVKWGTVLIFKTFLKLRDMTGTNDGSCGGFRRTQVS